MPVVQIHLKAGRSVDEKRALLSRACRLFDRIEYREQWWLLDGLKPFSLYEATVGNDDGSNDDGSSCPMPSYAWLDSPAPDSRHRDNLTIAGWAFNGGPGIGQIHILMNGERVGTLERAVDRPDVVRLTDAHRDPQSPLVGFQKTLPLESLPSGAVTLELEVQSTVGERQVFGRRTLQLYGPGS